MAKIHTHTRFLQSKKKWPTYHVAVCRTNRKHSSFAMKHFQRKSLKNFRPSSATEKVSIVCGTNKHVMLSNRHTHRHTRTQTHRPSTVTLTAHARRGLINLAFLSDTSKLQLCMLFKIPGSLKWRKYSFTPLTLSVWLHEWVRPSVVHTVHSYNAN